MSFTVNVIDCMYGSPAQGVTGRLERQSYGTWEEPVHGRTDENGLLCGWSPTPAITPGVYRLELDVDRYYATLGIVPLYLRVNVVLRVTDPADDHRVYVLITPFFNAMFRKT